MGLISSIYGRKGLRPVNAQSADSAGYKRRKKNGRKKLNLPAPSTGVLWLNVPYSDRVAATKAGARWNPEKKCWWVPRHAATGRFMRWLAPAAKRRHSK